MTTIFQYILHTAVPEYKSKGVTHTYFCCFSSSGSQRLEKIFLLQLLFPVCFLPSLSPFVLSCPATFSYLFMCSPLSLLCHHPPSIHLRLDFTLTWTSTFLCLLLPFTRSSIYIGHSQTVHGNELSASLRHSRWCGRWAASLSLSVSAFVFLSVWWKDGHFFSPFFSFGASGELDDANTQTLIHKCICRKAETYMC